MVIPWQAISWKESASSTLSTLSSYGSAEEPTQIISSWISINLASLVLYLSSYKFTPIFSKDLGETQLKTLKNIMS